MKSEQKNKWSVYGIEVVEEEPSVWCVMQPIYGFCTHCHSWEEVEEEARYIMRYVDREETYTL